jgi:TolA-binding protein
MKRSAADLDPELESLLHYRKVTRHLPDDVRARVLARSRVFVSDRRGLSRVAPIAASRPLAASSSQRSGLRRVAIAAAIAVLAGAAGAVAALRSRVFDARPAVFPATSGSPAIPVRPVREETDLDLELADVVAAPASATHHTVTSRPHPAPKTHGANPLAEVELLQHAHLAYARRDFRGALALVAEHARRFPEGPLAEECEALRVESLLAAGHAVEARRAGVTFAKRFPRSVLLPGIVETSHEDPAP